MPKAIFLIGPPGSGKGTQAELLAKDLDLHHLETSVLIERKFKETDPTTDREIAEQKKLWLKGELMDPNIIKKWFFQEIERLKDQVKGFVFSGASRTLAEAREELRFFETLYGKENILGVEIKLSEDESVKRNSTRRICKANRHPIPNFPEYVNFTTCPEDGSEIITRELDKPEIIKDRYLVYLRDTQPVIQYFKDNGYKVIEINGEQPIEKVFEDISKNLSI